LAQWHTDWRHRRRRDTGTGLVGRRTTLHNYLDLSDRTTLWRQR
jgi:hypothetical protein